jgi:hypothetical protein
VIALPPSLTGAVQLTKALWLRAAAVTAVGASGSPPGGVTALEGAEVGPEPTALVALTVKV